MLQVHADERGDLKYYYLSWVGCCQRMSDSWLNDEIERLEAELEEETQNSLVKNTAGLGSEWWVNRQYQQSISERVRVWNEEFSKFMKDDLLYTLFGRTYGMRKLSVGPTGRLLALQRMSDGSICPVISMIFNQGVPVPSGKSLARGANTNITVSIYKGSYQDIQSTFVDGCNGMNAGDTGDRMRDAFRDLSVHVTLRFMSRPGARDEEFVYGRGRCVIENAEMAYEHGCIAALGVILKRLWVNLPFVLREIKSEISKVVAKVEPEDVRQKLKWTVDEDTHGDGITSRTLWVMNGPTSDKWKQVLAFGMQRLSASSGWTCIRFIVFCDTVDMIKLRANGDTVGIAREQIVGAMRGMTPFELQTLIRSRLERVLATLGDEDQRAQMRGLVHARLLGISPGQVHDAVASVGAQLPQQDVIATHKDIVQISARLAIDESLSTIYGPCVMDFSGLDHVARRTPSDQGCIALIATYLRELWGIN